MSWNEPLPVIVIAKVKVKPEAHGAFAAAATHCALMTRTEPGCLEYDVYESATEPCAFTFVERWRDRASIDAHFLTPHLQELMRVSGTSLSAAPIIEAIVPQAIDRLA